MLRPSWWSWSWEAFQSVDGYTWVDYVSPRCHVVAVLVIQALSRDATVAVLVIQALSRDATVAVLVIQALSREKSR